MSIRTEHGFGPSTVEVEWLDDCPKCQHGKAKVTGWSVTSDSLWAGDETVCSKCGHKGEIDADGENAWVQWDEVRESSNIDKIALREAAEKATPDDWKYSTFDCAITDDTSSLAIVRMDSGHLNDEQSALNGAFIAAANPAAVLALLDELEAKDSTIAAQQHEIRMLLNALEDNHDEN